MGGNALKLIGLDSRRIETQELYDLTKEIQALTTELFIKIDPVKFYHTKPDHGDIDLVGVLRPGLNIRPKPTPEEKSRGYAPPPIWTKKLPEICGSKGFHWNYPVTSFEFKGVQIDISGHEDPQIAQTHLEFINYSPTGNVLNRMLKQTGVKWGVDGLTFPIRKNISGDGDLLGSVRLSYQIQEALEIADLPLKTWEDGFETQEDIFAWTCQSKLFNKQIYDFENLDHTNRKRDFIRPDYHAWRTYIEDKPDHYKRYETVEERTIAKTKWLEVLCKKFPNLGPAREEIFQSRKDTKINRAKLEGNWISKKTGLKGKELGDHIKDFKKTIGPTNKDWDNWLAKVSEAQAKAVYMAFLKEKNIGPSID